MNPIDAEQLRELLSLLLAIAASGFWVTTIMEALMGEGHPTPAARAASTATAFAAAVMIAQLSYAFSCTTCAG